MIHKTYTPSPAADVLCVEWTDCGDGEPWAYPIQNKMNLALVNELGWPVLEALEDTDAVSPIFMRMEAPSTFFARTASS